MQISDDMVRVVLAGLKLAIVFGGSGAIIALGMVGVCRFFEWAPINVTVNVYSPGQPLISSPPSTNKEDGK